MSSSPSCRTPASPSELPGSRGPALVFTDAELEAFLGGVKDGDFDDLLR